MTESIDNSHFVELLINRLKAAYGLEKDADVARLLDVTSAVVANWKKRGTIPYELLVTRCEDLSLEWLFRGTGPMRREMIERSYVEGERKFTRSEDSLRVDVIGKSTDSQSPEKIDSLSSHGFFLRDWLEQDVVIDPEEAFVVKVEGAKMAGELNDGDLVVGVKQSEITDDELYAIWYDNQIMVRLINRRHDTIDLIPAYRDFPTEVVTREDITVIGKVRAKVNIIRR